LLLNHPQIESNIADAEGLTPLHWASQTGKLNCIEILSSDDRVDFGAQDNEIYQFLIMDHPFIGLHSKM